MFTYKKYIKTKKRHTKDVMKQQKTGLC